MAVVNVCQSIKEAVSIVLNYNTHSLFTVCNGEIRDSKEYFMTQTYHWTHPLPLLLLKLLFLAILCVTCVLWTSTVLHMTRISQLLAWKVVLHNVLIKTQARSCVITIGGLFLNAAQNLDTGTHICASSGFRQHNTM